MSTKSPTGSSTASSTLRKKAIFDEQSFRNAWKTSWEKQNQFFYANLVRQTLSGAYKYLLKPDQVFYVGKYPMAYVLSIDENQNPMKKQNGGNFFGTNPSFPFSLSR